MKNSISLKHLLLPILLFACSLTAIPEAVHAQEAVRIRGQVAGTVTVVPLSIQELRFRVDYHAAGTVTGIGPVTAEFSSPDVRIDPWRRRISPATPTWNVNLELANGDAINGLYTFPTPVITYSYLGFFTIPIGVEVNGGSGAFAGAAGTAEARAFGNIYLRRFVILFDGEITTGH